MIWQTASLRSLFTVSKMSFIHNVQIPVGNFSHWNGQMAIECQQYALSCNRPTMSWFQDWCSLSMLIAWVITWLEAREILHLTFIPNKFAKVKFKANSKRRGIHDYLFMTLMWAPIDTWCIRGLGILLWHACIGQFRQVFLVTEWKVAMGFVSMSVACSWWDERSINTKTTQC